MTAPWVGKPTDEYRAVCLYSPHPGEPRCAAPATVHILVDDATNHGVVALASCDQHSGIARASGVLLMEHPHEGWCGLAGAFWDEAENRCVLDDSGREPALKAHAEAVS